MANAACRRSEAHRDWPSGVEVRTPVRACEPWGSQRKFSVDALSASGLPTLRRDRRTERISLYGRAEPRHHRASMQRADEHPSARTAWKLQVTNGVTHARGDRMTVPYSRNSISGRAGGVSDHSTGAGHALLGGCLKALRRQFPRRPASRTPGCRRSVSVELVDMRSQ